MLKLEILYYSKAGARPLRIASMDNESLIGLVGAAAIEDLEYTAGRLGEVDKNLGAVQLAEANKLRQVLASLLPRRPEKSSSVPELAGAAVQ
jgi:hypothetical protein